MLLLYFRLLLFLNAWPRNICFMLSFFVMWDCLISFVCADSGKSGISCWPKKQSSIFPGIHCQSCISAAKYLHNQNKGLCKEEKGYTFCPEAFTDSEFFFFFFLSVMGQMKMGSFTAVCYNWVVQMPLGTVWVWIQKLQFRPNFLINQKTWLKESVGVEKSWANTAKLL